MIRFYNGRVLSFDDAGAVRVTSDEVWVDGSVIRFVGQPSAREALPAFERSIDLKGDLLIPGFKNAHTHTPMTFLRSFADDLPLDRWLSELCWPNEAKLTDEAVRVFTYLGIMEYVSGGTTACFDMYSHSEAYASACRDAGFRTVLCSAMNDFDKDHTVIERDYLRYNNFGDLVSYILGIHAEYTTGMPRLRYMVDLAEKYQAPCFTHLCETKKETEGCLERYGLTPPQFLDRLGFFRYGGGGYHCVWFNEEDIRLFADKKLWVVTNPCSNLKLASGICPVTSYMDAGIPLAIGTDGAASNNALDMFREMYLVSTLQKVTREDAAVCNADRVLEMACVGGARCMGLTDCDNIAPGKKADLAVIDLQRPSMQPLNNLSKNLVYAGSKDCVRLTMVNGKVLYENGEFFLGESPAEIYRLAADFMNTIKG